MENENSIETLVRKHALLNAYLHDGRAEAGAVLGKLVADRPDLRSRIREISAGIREEVAKVNMLTQGDQLIQLKASYPEVLDSPKEKVSTEKELPSLPGAEVGKLVTRLPPEPSGFMHLGHAVAGLINHLYAKRYGGKLWLRFEDTNPRSARSEYYQSFRDGYRWLGIEWDHEKNVSDDLEIIYGYGLRLIRDGFLYSCDCSSEKVKLDRINGTACKCTNQSTDENLSTWEQMLNGKLKEGEASIRFRGDMASFDRSMRDPSVFRIVNYPHPLRGNEFVVWPNYDLAVVIEDYLCGVSHVLRSMEFHVTLQDSLRNILAFPKVTTIQFARVRFEGTPLSKRLLRPLVEKKLVSGWDDPRMPTIAGVKRRGILPEALARFTREVGYTRAEHTFGWDLLYSLNRKILDSSTRRIFFVPNPIQAFVANAPSMNVRLKYHPTTDLGERQIAVDGIFHLSRDDVRKMGTGRMFRLIDLYNVTVEEILENNVRLSFCGSELTRELPKIQWVTGRSVPLKLMVPALLFKGDQVNPESIVEVEGLAEEAVAFQEIGSHIQFPRVGFCILESPTIAILTHK